MKCEQAQQKLIDYLSGSLDPAELEGMEAHVRECAACRDEVACWRRLEGWPDEVPPPAMRVRFAGMLDRYEAEQARVAWWSPARWWPRTPAWQIAMAGLCGLAGWFVGQQPWTRPERTDVAVLRAEMRSLRELVTVSLLQQASASERLRGVSYSLSFERPDPPVIQALLRTLSLDPSVDVRLAAVDALRRYGREEAVRRGLAAALERPQSPLVQVALIEALVDLRERQSAAAFQRLAADRRVDEVVRQRAAAAAGEVVSY